MYNRLAVLIGVAAITPGIVYADVIAELGAPAAGPPSGYSAGDVITVPLALNSPDSRIAAVELEVHCPADAVQINGVEFDDAFPLVLSKNGAALPAQRYSAVRGQAIDDVLQPNAVAGGDQPFATISVEILTDKPFQAAVEITVRAAVAGRRQPATLIRTTDGRESASGTIRIPITSRGAIDGGAVSNLDGPAFSPSSFLPGTNGTFVPLVLLPTDSVAVEIRPVGGGRPTTILEADTEYELHFDAGDIPIHEYSAYAVAETPSESPSAAYPSSIGPWSDTNEFTVVDPLERYGEPGPARGFRSGLWRYLQVADSQPSDLPSTGTIRGHLFNFVTGEPGELNLHLYFLHVDLIGGTFAELETKVALTVE